MIIFKYKKLERALFEVTHSCYSMFSGVYAQIYFIDISLLNDEPTYFIRVSYGFKDSDNNDVNYTVDLTFNNKEIHNKNFVKGYFTRIIEEKEIC